PLPPDSLRSSIAADSLCFDDLAIAYDFAPAPGTNYQATSYDRQGHLLGAAAGSPNERGRSCIPLSLAPERDGYTMMRIQTTRPGFKGTTIVHIARNPATRVPRIVGIWRT
ncbi:MAG TPA: hypothetical protein VFD36_18790, partial [Kofleriaceae bacterium]|nr:hypothetical protein [Kofleriaceae bacterium]